MGNKNEGYLGGIMGGESRVGSGTTTTGTKKTVQDLTLQSDLSLVGDKVDKGNTNTYCDAYFPVSSGSGYQYLEVRYNADSASRKIFTLGLIKAANVESGTYGNDANSYAVQMDSSSLRNGAAGTIATTSTGNNSLDYIFGILLNRATGDVYISVCDPGSSPVWMREDNTESTTFDGAVPTFSGLDLSTFDTLYTQIYWEETYMNFNFGGNPLFDAEEASGNDSSTWYNDPPVSVVSFGQQEVTLKVANTGILSLEEAGTQAVEAASPPADMEVLLIGGGGGGASGKANGPGCGGGGAGEIFYASGVSFTEDVTITVGVGGAGGAFNANAYGSNGSQSTFSPGGVMEYNATGGGGGGKQNFAGKNSSGGSGGGGGAFSKIGGTGAFSGGVGSSSGSSPWRGGGGGGANGAGVAGNSGGHGGGATSIYSAWGIATSTGYLKNGIAWFGQGGGGGGGSSGGSAANGGGDGGSSSSMTGGAGVNSTGSGGGGGGHNASFGGAGGAGGKGVVIVRYSGPPVLTGGDTTVESGGYTYHTFTSSGTLEGPTNTETRTLPQLSWGGITGRSVLTGGSAGVPSYEIDHSLDFDGSADYLVDTLTTTGNRKTFTYSCWVKRSAQDRYDQIVASTTSTTAEATFRIGVDASTDNLLGFYQWSGSFAWKIKTTGTITDTEWHHVVLSVDTTQATAADRVKIYLDGSLTAHDGASTYMAQNADTNVNLSGNDHAIGGDTGWSFLNGKVADVHFIDGQALTASDFGETVSGTWYPKAYSGTYGSNGFYLDFADNSTTAALGNDVSGNSNNFTVNNMATTDQTTDVPASAPSGASGDDDWDDVTLLLDGSDPTDDLSSANQDASITNTGSVASASVTGPTGYGTVGALSFNGSSQCLKSSHYTSSLYNQDFTIEGWFYIDTLTTTALFSHRASTLDADGPQLYITAGGEFGLVVGDGTSFFINTTTAGSVTVSGWQHLALVRSGNNYTVYKDGQSIITASGSNTVSTSGLFILMGGFATVSTEGQLTSGDVFDFRITEGVARYTSNFTPPTESFPTSLLGTSGTQTLVNTGIFTLEEIYELTKALPVSVPLPTSMEVLLIGGGGGGGGNKNNGNGSGGGGAGEVKYLSSEAFTSDVSITIGAGGAGAVTEANGSNGGVTSYGATTANGGGGGANNGSVGNSVTGGSGGGGGSYNRVGGSGTYSGGTGTPTGNTNYRGGGGGGSTGNGVSGATSGNGGAGTSAYSTWATATSTGVSGAYAGGGGGGAHQPRTPGAGSAGGGSGGGSSGLNGTAAAANTGSGGGGAGWASSSHGDGGDGGSGLVIVRYSGSQALTGGTVVESGGYTYHTFTADGTLAAL